MTFYLAGLILHRAEQHPRATDLSGPDRLTLAALFSFAANDNEPVAYASTAKTASRTGLSRSAVQRRLNHLEQLGVIHGDHHNGRTTRWTLDPFFLARTSPGGGQVPDPEKGTPGLGEVRYLTSRRSGPDLEKVTTCPPGGHEVTEVSDRPKGGNERTEPRPIAAASSGGSAPLAASSTPPPRPTWEQPPSGAVIHVDGQIIGTVP